MGLLLCSSKMNVENHYFYMKIDVTLGSNKILQVTNL